MSQSNVDIVRSLYQAFADGDVPAVLELMDPKIEWREADGFLYADGNPYVGPEAVLQGVFMRIGADWEDFNATPSELLDAGDTVVGCGYYTGRSRETGKEVKAQFAHVFTLADGKISRFQQYTDTAQFAAAVSG